MCTCPSVLFFASLSSLLNTDNICSKTVSENRHPPSRNSESPPMNVLLVQIDSVSRGQWLRALNKTTEALRNINKGLLLLSSSFPLILVLHLHCLIYLLFFLFHTGNSGTLFEMIGLHIMGINSLPNRAPLVSGVFRKSFFLPIISSQSFFFLHCTNKKKQQITQKVMTCGGLYTLNATKIVTCTLPTCGLNTRTKDMSQCTERSYAMMKHGMGNLYLSVFFRLLFCSVVSCLFCVSLLWSGLSCLPFVFFSRSTCPDFVPSCTLFRRNSPIGFFDQSDPPVDHVLPSNQLICNAHMNPFVNSINCGTSLPPFPPFYLLSSLVFLFSCAMTRLHFM